MFIGTISESSHKKRHYFVLLGGALIFLVVARVTIFFTVDSHFWPKTINIINLFLDNLIALDLSVLIASCLYLWFMPNKIRKGDIHVLPSYDIEKELNKIIEDTEHYYYVGHTARWTRSVTLEKLKDKARLKNTRTEIAIIILDPSDVAVCEYYSKFGHANRKNSTANNIKNVQIELITTILICAKYSVEPLLYINLYFINQVSLFRLDISDTGLILTKPSDKEPALLFLKDTFFYNSYKEEFKVIRDQSNRIMLDKLELNKDREYYYSYLQKIGLPIEGFNFTDDDFEKIIKELNKPTKPY